MGQVPMPTILIVGNGKAAKHLSFYFNNIGYHILSWHYKINDFSDLNTKFNRCTYCFILIKDDALQKFTQDYDFIKSDKSFHCSGSRSIEGVRCIHPLMTFSENLYEKDFYKKIHWAIFEENKCLRDYILYLPNPYFYVKFEQKNFYHAMCVMSGNFTQLLLQQVLFQWQETLHLNQESLQPYLQMTLEKFWNIGPHGLTGPLARKDYGTIKKHLRDLNSTPLFDLYKSFLKLYLTEEEIVSHIEESTKDKRINQGD
jgi:hypothetical protein